MSDPERSIADRLADVAAGIADLYDLTLDEAHDYLRRTLMGPADPLRIIWPPPKPGERT